MGENKLIIFDIDNALDKLEDEIINEEIPSTVNSSTQNQTQKNLFVHENNEIIKNETLESNNDENLSVEQQLITPYDDIKENDEERDLQSIKTQSSETKQFIPENNEDICNQKDDDASSDNTISSGVNENIEKVCDNIKNTCLDETHKELENSKDSISPPKEGLLKKDEYDDQDVDLPATTDLTLTKTVEPTEYDEEHDEASLQQADKNIGDCSKVKQVNKIANEVLASHDKELIVHERIAKDYIKDASNNFESTMDDISDAELESLEQELDDLIASDNNMECYMNIIIQQENGTSVKQNEKVEVQALETENQIQINEIAETSKASDNPVKEEGEKDESANLVDNKIVDVKTDVDEKSNLIAIETKQNDIEHQESPSIGSETTESQLPVDEDSLLSVAISTDESTSITPKLNVNSDLTPDESTSIQNLPQNVQLNEECSNNESNSTTTGSLTSQPDLGKVPPYWIPDDTTNLCMQCDQKFSIIKRRHHCRACGLLLCSACCNEKFFLPYLQTEGRICVPCHEILIKVQQQQHQKPKNPNPQNPNEYCSKVPVTEQASANAQPPSVMVPVGVLKRTSSTRTSERKSVMFSDGIRPGTDLNETTPTQDKSSKYYAPTFNEKNNSYIPESSDDLPPVLFNESDYKYLDNNLTLLEHLKQEELKFVINKNFFVLVKIVTLTCCTNKIVINFATSGLLAVKQDELLILLELTEDMTQLPKELFLHLNEIYRKADKNIVIKEYGYSQAASNNFLGAFGGFLYVRPTFQCLQSLLLPENPYLIGLLVHKWEVPWMKLFPLRLVLRLGALYRYYPTPILSSIKREPVYAEIGNTIMNFLVDFRNFTYSIELIKGLNIHMEERKTFVLIPRNRYNQIIRIINNSTDHLLAFGADFSKHADGHLVCIQNIDSGSSESYSTQAINIQGQNRIRTGASFLILNGALKQSSGLKGKCSIVEDGLMIQVFPTKMQNIRDCLKNMKNIDIPCGSIEDDQKEVEETVSIEWIDDDLNFNLGVTSPIDNLPFEGKESIRIRLDITSHAQTKILRWSEVVLLEFDEASALDDHLNYSKLCEPIAKACGNALLPFLDLMAVNHLRKLGVRVTLGENIKYLAGSNKVPFSPIYMNALDNELIPVIHRQANNLSSRQDANVTMELIFFILDK